ncbi:hypothetical protein OSB04_013807 [Centaurea solstitialis]|uniref:Uncharacterized protein n=1 Tax=Centaurea solstitialis TaxID=347529 RepID=A0AA38TYP0_9ASTR|nr:hypothetical protein OSB04_013807 [Centaurea solstitialis]
MPSISFVYTLGSGLWGKSFIVIDLLFGFRLENLGRVLGEIGIFATEMAVSSGRAGPDHVQHVSCLWQDPPFVKQQIPKTLFCVCRYRRMPRNNSAYSIDTHFPLCIFNRHPLSTSIETANGWTQCSVPVRRGCTIRLWLHSELPLNS